MIVTLLSVALIVALVLVVRRPFARRFGAKAAYALWALPLARLVLPPIPDHLAPFGWLAMSPPAGAPAPTPAPAIAGPHVDAPVAPAAPVPQPPAPAETPAAIAPQPAGAGTVDWLPTLGLIASSALLAGAAILLARQCFLHWQFMRLVRLEGQPASPALRARVDALAGTVGLRRTPRVRTSLLSSGPLVTGLARPVILLPAWFEADYSETEQRAALTHELMHVKRGDLIALQLAHIVAALQWFNPLTWRALRAFRADQEAACDADVLALGATSPRAYGATLLKAIRQANPAARATPVAAGLPLGHDIKDRFALLDTPEPSRSRRRTATAITLALGTTLVLGTAGTVSAQDEELEGGTSGEREVIIRSDMKDRQLILLDDPTKELRVYLDKIERAEMPQPPEPPIPPMPPMPPLPPDAFDMSFLAELGELGELAELQDFALAVAGSVQVDSVTNEDGGVTITINTSNIDMSEFEARFEQRAARWAEQVDAHAEDWGARFGAEMERWAADFESRMAAYERDAEEIAARAEAMAAEVDRITESPEFETALKKAADAASALRDACEAEEFADGDVALIETASGAKAVCIKGGRDRLSAEEIKAAVMAHPGLTEHEKARWLERRAHNLEMHLTID